MVLSGGLLVTVVVVHSLRVVNRLEHQRSQSLLAQNIGAAVSAKLAVNAGSGCGVGPSPPCAWVI